MSFFQRMKESMARFMQGRYGVDHLGNFTLFFGLGLSILDMFLGTGLLGILGLVLYFFTIFRMFSRNKPKRMAENQKYLALTGNLGTKARQAIQRFKNRKLYKYFKCPKCRAMLRLTRGCGQVHVTCARCKHEFEQNA